MENCASLHVFVLQLQSFKLELDDILCKMEAVNFYYTFIPIFDISTLPNLYYFIFF